MKIIGHIICQDGIGEIMRAIDSMYPIVDELYIVDGGSTDGTIELLERFKDSYGFQLYHNKFESMDQQRNFLLEKTEPESWIVSIDQDEKFSSFATKWMRPLLLEQMEAKIYEGDNSPILAIPLLNLHKNPLKMRNDNCYVAIKAFYFRKGLKFVEPYHSILVYPENNYKITLINAPLGLGILHYARMDRRRYKNWDADMAKGREYDWKDWDPEAEAVPLDKIWW